MSSRKKKNKIVKFRKLLIANRGEIVLRIIKACKELSIRTAALYSQDDKNHLIDSAVDEYIHLPGNGLSATYLNMRKIIDAAKRIRADAIHPGYGFLAENPLFAKACEDNDVTFIGPSSNVLEKVGNKIEARCLAKELGIPIVEGSQVLDSKEDALEFTKEHGYPVILKACGGGGGRGIRIARNRKELLSCFDTATREVSDSFVCSTLYAEKYIKARHIEFQIIADNHGNVVNLFDRECSIQRRFQKLVEEAPANAIPARIRRRMGEIACLLPKKINYIGAGTVEFLFTPENRFYFLEINPRIQVEHGITEMITGIDIVKEQLRIAQGLPLSVKQEDVKINGHSIECRIVAEHVRNNFAPSGGTVKEIIMSGKEQRKAQHKTRIDTALHPGLRIDPVYDSLLAKLMVWGKSRKSALKGMNIALNSLKIEGVANTISFYSYLINHKDFIDGNVSTDFITEKEIVDKYARSSLTPDIVALIASAIYEHESRHNLQFKKPSKWVQKSRRHAIEISD